MARTEKYYVKLLHDLKAKINSVIEYKPLRYGSLGFVCAIAAYGVWWVGTPIYNEYQSSFAAKEFKEYGIIGTYERRFFTLHWKLKEMEMVDRENEELNHKVASLEKEVNELSAHLTEQDAKAATEATSKRLKAEAGSALARAMSEIHYKAPTNVLPYQLYSIGLAYFRKQQFEQAAVIFNQLLSLSEDASYRRSEIYLLNAICWFKLKHYQLANASLVEAKKMSNEHSPYFRKALLWQAMVAQALGERVKSQDILTMLIAMYPHSEEAMSINRKSGRSIASEGEATHE